MRKNSSVITNHKGERLKPADVVRLLPVIIFTSVVFLLVRVHEYTMPLSGFPFMSGDDDTALFDCFSYIKSVAVMISAALAVILMVYFMIVKKRRIRKTVTYIPMAVYAFFIVISYLSSDWKQFSLIGTYDRFEGTVVHICYLFIAFYAINFVDNEKEIKAVIDTMFAGVTIACLVGLTQFLGVDFFAGNIGKKLILGKLAAAATFNFGQGKVYQTVYNINYVGFYLCLVLPVLLCRIIDTVTLTYKEMPEREKKRRIFYLIWLPVLLVLVILNIAGSDSAGSLAGIAFGAVGVFIVRFSKKKRNIGFITVMICAIAGAVILSAGLLGRAFSPFIKDVSERPDIEYIRTGDKEVDIYFDGHHLYVSYDPGEEGFLLTDDSGEPISTFTLPEDESRYELHGEGYKGVVSFTPMALDGRLFAVIGTKDEQWVFEFNNEGVTYINEIANSEKLEPVAHAGIFKNYRFATGRGYLWDTTLPLLKERVFKGSGADTFMFVFPQNDYAVRYSHELEINCVYDKPHNMFLQMAVSFGIFGVISFVLMIASAFLPVSDNTDDEKETKPDTLRLSILTGIAAFLIASLFNDSSVQVMPMFYGLFGCACAGRLTR